MADDSLRSVAGGLQHFGEGESLLRKSALRGDRGVRGRLEPRQQARYRRQRPGRRGVGAREARRLSRERVAMLHGHEFAMSVYAASAARLARIPALTTLHGRHWVAGRRLRARAYRILEAAGVRIAAVSNDLAGFLAGASGVNIAEWRECVRSRAMERVVNGDKYRAASSGARSTPTFFVGDQPIAGAQPIDSFRLAIQRARAKAGNRSP